jgi:TusA-related sulfurtransferase
MLRRTLDLRHLPPLGGRASIDDAVAALEFGELIEVLASDTHAIDDFRATSKPIRTDLLESSRLGTVFRFVLRKA